MFKWCRRVGTLIVFFLACLRRAVMHCVVITLAVSAIVTIIRATIEGELLAVAPTLIKMLTQALTL